VSPFGFDGACSWLARLFADSYHWMIPVEMTCFVLTSSVSSCIIRFDLWSGGLQADPTR